jgi:hypothetical protein
MKGEDLIRKLAEKARMEEIPKVDVSDQVMRIIRSAESTEELSFSPFAWVAGASAAIALPVFLFGITSWSDWSSPLLNILSSLTWRI